MSDSNKNVAISYITIQVFIALLVSFVGVVHVKHYLNKEDLQRSIRKGGGKVETKQEDIEEDDILLFDSNNEETEEKNPKEDKIIEMKENVNEPYRQRRSFCVLWAKTVWKMRSVYAGLAVHSFDVLTDVLVILEWFNTPNVSGDNIDPKAMAYSALAVLIFSKILSTVTIYVKERNISRSFLQFCDLLIFAEILESHRKIISQIKNANIKDKNNAIESTLSFKYIRSCEAVFESIPECVLQLVYVMRTSTIEALFIISIIQSIISMTNSILNNDYTQMQSVRFATYKQRLPPTLGCLKHTISRLSEVMYRVGLLSLFWSVCGGLALGILLIVEILFISIRIKLLIFTEEAQFDPDIVLLSINSIIVIPTEEVYAHSDFHNLILPNNGLHCCVFSLFNCFCCVFSCAAVASIGGLCSESDISYIPVTKMGISFVELLFMFFWALYAENGEREKFLFDYQHGCAIFIATIVSFCVYTQYVALFPDFALPFGVNVRSKWGYAFANELNELEKIKVPTQLLKNYRRAHWDESRNEVQISIAIQNTFKRKIPVTAAVIAEARGHNHIVAWLEEQGAIRHTQWLEPDSKMPAIYHLKQTIIPTKKGLKQLVSDKRMGASYAAAFHGHLNELQNCWIPRTMKKKIFWDQESDVLTNVSVDVEIDSTEIVMVPLTAAVIAKAQGHNDIVKWLERKDAIRHKHLFPQNTIQDDKFYLEKIEIANLNFKGKYAFAFSGDLEGLKKYEVNISRKLFWDEPCQTEKGVRITAAVFALKNQHHEIVQWLEKKGANSHKNISIQTVNKIFDDFICSRYG